MMVAPDRIEDWGLRIGFAGAEFQSSTLCGVGRKLMEPEVKAAWSREIERRVREVEDGTAELIPWEEVRAELFADE
jgi:hypothetical protein